MPNSVKTLKRGGVTRTAPAPTDDTPWYLPKTKSGTLKRKLGREEKLIILDPDSSLEKTMKRLDIFIDLFAFRKSDAIVTHVNAGPRSWSKLRGGLRPVDVVRHLLADRVPTLPVLWFGARSFKTTRWFCLDVDADRDPERELADRLADSDLDQEERDWLVRREQRKRQANSNRPVPSFTERCARVEEFFRAIGIDPCDGRQLLIQPTPSGGRHYYVFMGHICGTDQFRDLAQSAGILETKGQIEFFPSVNKAIRLPFGFTPGRPHDPRAWIRFIDDYTAGRIKRHSLAGFYTNLERWQNSRREESVSPGKLSPKKSPAPTIVRSTKQYMGIPKKDQLAAHFATKDVQRYREIIANPRPTFREVEELWSLGILAPGTRTDALKILAAHLIWFRQIDHQQAAEALTAWAYDARHASKDIHDDLRMRTKKVATQIASMCEWYAKQKKTGAKESPRLEKRSGPTFAAAELASMQRTVQSVPTTDRAKFANFLLSFLAYAKKYGTPEADGDGWRAAPAVVKVIRRWPCCNHSEYKRWIKYAADAGCFAMVREKWQRAGGKGRARTYRLAVPVVAAEEWKVDYPTALELLTSQTPIEAPSRITLRSRSPLTRNQYEETEHANESRTPADRNYRNVPTAVYPASSGGGLEPRPHQRDPKSAPVVGVSRPTDGTIRADPIREHRRAGFIGDVASAWPELDATLTFEEREAIAYERMAERVMRPDPELLVRRHMRKMGLGLATTGTA